jgi:hypothetical protein
MSSFTWKCPRDLETQQGCDTPQDLETRYLPWHKPHASPTRARFSQPIFSEIRGSRTIRQLTFLAAAARLNYKKIRWRQKSHGSLAFSAAGRSAP